MVADMKHEPTTITPEGEAILAELVARWPQLDWLEVLGDLSHTTPPEKVADWLIDVGCDPTAVKTYILDETLDY